jgi:DNA-binding GntR family transcriptional regulator
MATRRRGSPAGDGAATPSGETSSPAERSSGDRRPGELASFLAHAPGRGSTADAATDALREAILDGLIPASTWLREEDIAAELQLSRTPVREAIRRLTSEGLAVRMPNHGTQVAPMAMEDILAVYTVRENLEGLAARLAAQRASESLRVRLREIHERFKAAAADGDAARLSELNLEFHRAIREATDNRYLERFLTLVEHAVRRFRSSTFENPRRMDATVYEHESILNAIVNGMPEDAEVHARSHMRRAREARLEAFLKANS